VDIQTLRARIAAMRDDASSDIHEDDAIWEAEATGQDTEAAEWSGVLIGREEAFRQVLDLIDEHAEEA
jgi:hypothetical protein